LCCCVQCNGQPCVSSVNPAQKNLLQKSTEFAQ
jgi:hypothetical protein